MLDVLVIKTPDNPVVALAKGATMGTLRYGTGDDSTFEMEDADLAHLAAVVTAKLRRREPFLLTCRSETTRRKWRRSARHRVTCAGQPLPIPPMRCTRNCRSRDGRRTGRA